MIETDELVCDFCSREFKRASSFEKHMCEQKRRFNSRNEPGPRLGFYAYSHFYKINSRGSKQKTVDEYIKSPYYKAFTKFGQYCVDVKVINPNGFVQWLLKKNKGIDYWTSDKLYTEFLVEYLVVEPVADALARSIEWSIDWGERTEGVPKDCLRYGNPNVIVYAITGGRISPWVLYACESGQKFLEKLDSALMGIIWSYIDSGRWGGRLVGEDMEYARDILKRAGW